MFDDRTLTTPYGQMPPVMRVLNVAAEDHANGRPSDSSTVGWLDACLANDSAMAVKLEHATLEAAMTLLRQESFDVVILHHEVGKLDAVAGLAPIRAASPDYLAVVVMGEEGNADMTAHCLENAADAYYCRRETDVRTLLWGLARAAERQRLLRDAHTYQQALETKAKQHHQEALHQLRSQRSVLVDHFALSGDEVDGACPPPWLVNHFTDLLRIYVVSGTGTLREEVSELVDRLEHSEVTLAEALMAHTLAAEELVLGLGNRPAWHILGRANLLAYELIMQLQHQRSSR